MNKTTKITGWILTTLISAVLLFSAFGKFFMEEMQANMERYGVGDWNYMIAAEELFSTVLFIIPLTNRFGVLPQLILLQFNNTF